MNRLLIHYVEGEDVQQILDRVKLAILSGVTSAKNSEFNFTLDQFDASSAEKISSRCLCIQDISHMSLSEIDAFLTVKDKFVGLDWLEAEILLELDVENLSDKEIILKAKERNILTQIFK